MLKSGKAIPHVLRLDKSKLGRSFNSTLEACLDKYFSVPSCPKISERLELSKVSDQTSKAGCIGLGPVAWVLIWLTDQMTSNWAATGLI